MIDGRISRNRPSAVVQKYKPSTSGILTSVDDISILIDITNLNQKMLRESSIGSYEHMKSDKEITTRNRPSCNSK